MPNPPKPDPLKNRLETLSSQLKTSDGKRAPKTPNSDSKNYGNAYRLSSEFVAAILVGSAIGWAIDKVLGTTPWAMIIMLPLGFVAGVMNILRTTGLTPGQEGDTGSVENNEKGFSKPDKSVK